MRKIGKVIFSDRKERIETEVFYDGKKLTVDLSEIKKFLFKYDGDSNIIFDIAFDIARMFSAFNIDKINFDSISVSGNLKKRNLKNLSDKRILTKNEIYSLLLFFKKL